MKHIAELPWHLEMDDHDLDAVLWGVDESKYKCDMADRPLEMDTCHPAPLAIGTSDSREPKFCLKHYFEVNDGDGIGNYKIVPGPAVR